MIDDDVVDIVDFVMNQLEAILDLLKRQSLLNDEVFNFFVGDHIRHPPYFVSGTTRVSDTTRAPSAQGNPATHGLQG